MGVLDTPVRPSVGHLTDRPSAVGSKRLYYATDDCGGTLHLDVAASTWRRTHPRGELVSVTNTQPSNYTATGTLTSVYALYLEVITDEPRPVEITIEGRVQVGRSGVDSAIAAGSTKFARLSLDEGGTKIADAYVYASVINDEARVKVTARRNLLAGTTYTYRAYIASQDTTLNVRTVGGMILKAVEL